MSSKMSKASSVVASVTQQSRQRVPLLQTLHIGNSNFVLSQSSVYNGLCKTTLILSTIIALVSVTA